MSRTDTAMPMSEAVRRGAPGYRLAVSCRVPARPETPSPGRPTRAAALLWVIPLVLLLAPLASWAGPRDLTWRTLTTDHFFIHYHQGTEVIARRTADMAEEAHRILVPIMEWEPLDRTHIVIMDSSESSNGSAQVAPRAQIVVYTAPPRTESTLGDYDDWLRILIIHEYTHILHLQDHSGVSRVINKVLGPTYFPNQAQPLWFIEGITVLNESKFTSAGRMRGATFEMYLRTNVLEGTFYDLDQVSSGVLSWPSGNVPYLYGSRFLSYIADRFGYEKLIAMAHEYGGDTLPYGINKVATRILGRTFTDLYEDWKKSLEEKYGALRNRLTKKGLTLSKPLTTRGMDVSPPKFSPDGRYIYYSFSDGHQIGGLWRVPRDGGEPEKMCFLRGVYSMSPDPTGRMFYYSASAPYLTTYRFYDLFRFDPGTGHKDRLTRGLRSGDPIVSPDGRLLLFNRLHGETRDLLVSDTDGQNIRVLVAASTRQLIDTYAWSADGQEAAYTLFRPGGDYALCRVSREGKPLGCVLDERSLILGPAYDPSGRYLLFGSDRTGIFNLYAFDLLAGRLWQVTNVLTGAEYPTVSPDGKVIAFLRYSSTGWDLHVMPFDPGSWMDPDPLSVRPPASPDPKRVATTDEPYDPSGTILPQQWMFSISDTVLGQTLGLSVGAEDAVSNHSFGAGVSLGLEDFDVAAVFAYRYYGIRPNLSGSVSRSLSPGSGFEVAGKSRPFLWVTYTLTLNASFAQVILDYPQEFTAGWVLKYSKPRDTLHAELDPDALMPSIPNDWWRSGLRLAWNLDRSHGTSYGISAETGRDVSASLTLYDPILGSDGRSLELSYRWTEYIGIPWFEHHVLVLGYSGGIGYGSDSLFGIGGFYEVEIIDAIINDYSASGRGLRGYPQGVMFGNQYHLLQAEYRFPILDIYKGYETLPLYLRRLQGTVFCDTGTAIKDSISLDDIRTGLGAELILSFTVGYLQTQYFRIGYAYGFMDKGGNTYYITLGGPF